jgi:putative two-component system response regulator
MVVSYFHEGATRQRTEPDMEALRQTQALLRTQETVIFALAKLSDSRDPDTGDHLERISYYSSTLAAALRQHPDFRDVVTPSLVRLIGISSALHDIGKVGVEDSILKKPGSLTTAERSRMQLHTRVGEDCLKEIERRLGTSNFLQMAREIASAHHERWDGTGYPLGLAGEQIPVAARIVALADVYDALSSKRVYKDALPHEKCVELILQEAGKHFDPRLAEVFAQIEPSFRVISRHLGAASDATAEHRPARVASRGADETPDPDRFLTHAGSRV